MSYSQLVTCRRFGHYVCNDGASVALWRDNASPLPLTWSEGHLPLWSVSHFIACLHMAFSEPLAYISA